ncbi:MAG: type IV pilus modification PilV family protein [Gemmatimonadales bacterium]
MKRDGFTLLEVLLAVLIITGGVLGFLGALGAIARLAAEGRERSRIVLVLEARLDRLRAELWATGCGLPGAGTLRWPDGVSESWEARAGVGTVEFLVTASIPGRRRAPDSVLTRVACP